MSYGNTRRTRCKRCGILQRNIHAHRMTCGRGVPNPNDGTPGERTPAGDLTVAQFNDMTSALAVADLAPPSNANQSRTNGASATWDLNTGFAKATRLARDGWSKPRADVDSLTGAIDGELRDLVIESTSAFMDVAGGEVDVADYLTGEPECMRDHRYTEQSAQREVVTIAVGIAASCAVSADTILRRGAAVCALVDLVARAGYTVELWADMTSRGHGGHRIAVQVKVHSPEDRLDVDAVMYALAHPAMLRRTVFALMEQQPADVRRAVGIGGGYGMPCEPTVDALPHPPTITLGTVATGDFRDTATSIAWVRDHLRKLGILDTER